MTRKSSMSNAQRAAVALRELIFSGELAAGSDHLETELAQRLGMSRTPVREAALVLEGQGLLEVRPRKGVRICPVSPRDMHEIYEVLTALESLAAERAAQAGYSDDALETLRLAIEDMEAATGREDRRAWAEADDRFHAELVRLGGNRRIVEIAGKLSDQVRRARMVTLFVRPLPVRSNVDHRAVYEAIRKGDAGEAGERHRRHRSDARDELVSLLEQMGLNQV
jgi:DNA-binding GntR family transcriptional regulator